MKKDKNTLKLAVSISIPVLIYLIWPYMALLKLYIGLESNNKGIVMEEVNWPSFRDKIESDLNRYVKEVLNKNLAQENIKLSFRSLSLTRKIADQIATPEGLIHLYHFPDNYANQIKKIFAKKAEPKHLSPPSKEKPLNIEGPNIPSLWDQINYIFFIDISHFKASFKINNKPFTIIWERQGFDWKVETLDLPLI
ncbi:MAG: DUF2939 domain-containing protein [Nitrospinae bacterium]|nr:DUF2939 domain-containing protein [Nitrospinota bacterium]MZH42663.1 DUF2939 domain-containing protein [Nitrospinota bacterium]